MIDCIAKLLFMLVMWGCGSHLVSLAVDEFNDIFEGMACSYHVFESTNVKLLFQHN